MLRRQICALLGAPERDWQRFSGWADDVLRLFSWNLAGTEDAILRSWDELDEYVDHMVAERRDTLTDDLVYFMPMMYNVKFGEHASGECTRIEKDMSWFNEGKWSVGKRVEQIMTGVHWAEEPLSRVCRLVSNVQLRAMSTNAAGELEVDVTSRFLIYQNRCEYEEYFFVGDRFDRIRRTADGWKLAQREIRIHQNVLLAKNLSIFF